MRFGAARYGAVRYSAVRYGAVRYDTMRICHIYLEEYCHYARV